MIYSIRIKKTRKISKFFNDVFSEFNRTFINNYKF
jgi:hypothetical protein